MADAPLSQKSHDLKSDLNKTSTEIAVQDPKNLQDLTQYVIILHLFRSLIENFVKMFIQC